MIPGLSIDSETERKVWLEFTGWAEHFKRDLAATGVEGLLARYSEVVESAATESCGHGPNGSRRVGSDWRACCGESYEYLNDISVRTAIERIVALIPVEAAGRLRVQTEVLDRQLRELIDEPNSAEPWWYALPRTVVP